MSLIRMKNALVDQLNVQVMPPDSAADTGSVMICINGTPKHHQKNNLFLRQLAQSGVVQFV